MRTIKDQVAVNMLLDKATRAGLKELIKHATYAKTLTGAVRVLVARYVMLLRAQLQAETDGGSLFLVHATKSGAEKFRERIDMRL